MTNENEVDELAKFIFEDKQKLLFESTGITWDKALNDKDGTRNSVFTARDLARKIIEFGYSKQRPPDSEPDRIEVYGGLEGRPKTHMATFVKAPPPVTKTKEFSGYATEKNELDFESDSPATEPKECEHSWIEAYDVSKFSNAHNSLKCVKCGIIKKYYLQGQTVEPNERVEEDGDN